MSHAAYFLLVELDLTFDEGSTPEQAENCLEHYAANCSKSRPVPPCGAGFCWAKGKSDETPVFRGLDGCAFA